MYRHFSILFIVLIFTYCTDNSSESIKNPLRQFIESNLDTRHMLDSNRKVELAFWDTIYLPKYRLTIFQYNAHHIDGTGLYFLVEDSANVFFTIRRPYISGLTTFVPHDKVLEMLSDTLFQFEPIEYEFAGFEDYINESMYFKNRPIDLEVLDTLIKIKYFNILHPVTVVKDSLDISNTIKFYAEDDNKLYKSKLKSALIKTLNRTNNRIFNISETEFLYVDYDPYYSGNLQPETFRDTFYINKTKEPILRRNSLDKQFNFRFIRIHH